MLYDGFIVLDTRESSYEGQGSGIPGVGTQDNSTPDSASKGNAGQWFTPETIAATLGLVTTVAAVTQKTPDQKAIKAACGARPLISPDKKKKYQECVDRYIFQQQQANMPIQPIQQSRMSTGAIVLIVFVILIILAVFGYLIYKSKQVKPA